MSEAKEVLSSSCQSRDVDIVVARKTSDGNNSSSDNNNVELEMLQMNAETPLSLLATHDEHDLINLSSVPLRPCEDNVSVVSSNDGSSRRQPATIIRISGADHGPNRALPKMPTPGSGTKWALNK